MNVRFIARLLIVSCILWGMGKAQVVEEEEQRKTTTLPQVIDFSKIFDQTKMTREDFELWKSRREAKIRERLSMVEALEQAIDPEEYIVGPGDVFSFNIWGALEMQLPLMVSPEGKLLVPSVGEIEVDGKTLHEVQNIVYSKAIPVYENSDVSLTLDALRFFRVHVIGEVQFPSTYIAQAVDRISGMITEAGGVTERAWKGRIELRHSDGRIDFFDLDSFELEGNLTEDRFVNGGDVIYVPPLEIGGSLVTVSCDIENSGTHQIAPGEQLLGFLQRIRVLKRNTDLSKIVVLREDNDDSHGSGRKRILTPFKTDESIILDFPLQNGDEVILPSTFVYVKGAVRNPGAFPYIMNLTAKDYAGMAGGEYRSGSIKSIRVYRALTGKTEKGADVLVEAGDVVHLNPAWSQRFVPYVQIISVLTSLVIAAKAVGIFGQ